MPASRILPATLFSALLLGASGAALAGGDREQTQAYEAWAQSEVTTRDAATIAEQATGGTATSVTFDHGTYGSSVYRVETQTGPQVSEVEVDARSGEIRNVTRAGASQRSSSPIFDEPAYQSDPNYTPGNT